MSEMIWKNTIPGVVDSTASRFNETSTYKKSDYVWYVAAGSSPKLYKAKEDISAGAFDASKWEQIVETNEFVSKDLVGSKYKNVSEDFEGNRFGYRKYEAWCEFRPTSDSGIMYNKNDVIYYIDSDGWGLTLINKSDDPCTLQSVINDNGVPVIYRDWDSGELREEEGFVPVEGELYSGVDEGFNDCFYKYSGGTYTKIDPVDLNIEAVKAAGFNPGDWFVVSNNGALRIAKFLTENPSSEFVDVDLFDVAVCQGEVAKKLEDINENDYYYGMPFYKDYQLYALLATTSAYEDVACEGSIDHDKLNITHIGNIYAAKLDSINDIHKLFDNNSYFATQALIFNIWDGRFGLPVLGYKCYGNLSQINIVGTPITDGNFNVSGITIEAGMPAKYNVTWDMQGYRYMFGVDGFSNPPWAGEEPPKVNVHCLEVHKGTFTVYDGTTNPDGEDRAISQCHAGLGFTMAFYDSYYELFCDNNKGIFKPFKYMFFNSDVSFIREGGDYTINLDTAGASSGKFSCVNSHVVVENYGGTLKLEHCLISGLNSEFHINANKIIAKHPINLTNLEHSELSISAEENIVAPVDSYYAFFELGNRITANKIRMLAKWDATTKDKDLLHSSYETVTEGMFDNVFEFRDSEATVVTECPFKFDTFGRLIHMGNKMYVNQYGADKLIWHDYPAGEGGTDFHAEFIRALDKLTTQLGLTYTAIQDASGDYQYTFNLNN